MVFLILLVLMLLLWLKNYNIFFGWNKEKIKYAVNCTKNYYAIVIQNWWKENK